MLMVRNCSKRSTPSISRHHDSFFFFFLNAGVWITLKNLCPSISKKSVADAIHAQHAKTFDNPPLVHSAHGSQFDTTDPSARHSFSATGITNTRKSSNGGTAAAAAAATAAVVVVGASCACF